MALTGRVVVLRALGLGDLLTAVPALRALRRAFPGCRLTLCTAAPLAGLAHLAVRLDEVCDAAPLALLPERLGRPDVAVNLHGAGPQSHDVLERLNPRYVLCFANDQVPWSAPGPAWPAEVHEVERWCGMLAAFGICSGRRDLYLDLDARREPGLTLIHPGAASAARRWPAERFAEVARRLAWRNGRVLVTGSAGERSLASEVARLGDLPTGSVLAGDIDLLQLARLIARASLVVCGDTGVAHLATALRTPSVVLFGPTSPRLWGPPPGGPHQVIWHGTTGDPHAETPDPGLLDIAVEEVLQAVHTLAT